MTLYDVILYIHLLGFVFWLGTDIGVFIGAKFTENAEYSVETRMAILKLAMVLDIAPRVAMPVVFSSGLYLSHVKYGVEVPPLGLGLTLSAIWLGIVALGIFNKPETKLGATAQKLNLGANVFVLLAMGSMGLMSLFGADYFTTSIAVKWLAFAWIALFAIGIDYTFKPAIADYMRLMTEGASDEINASLTKHLKPVYLTVIAVYLGTMFAAYVGQTQVFG